MELFISWRYFATKKKQKFLWIMSMISAIGVAIGVMTLIVVISVMTGFDEDLKDKITGHISHIQIEGFQPFSNYQSIVSEIKKIEYVQEASPYILGQVFLYSQGRFFPLGLKGIDLDEERKITKIKEYLVRGDLNLDRDQVIIGKELSYNLGLDLGDELVIFSPNLSKPKSLKIKGVFYSGMYDYDLNLAYTNLETSQEIFNLHNKIQGIGVKLQDLFLAQRVKKRIQESLGEGFFVSTWMEKNKNFFAALKLEKITMFVILTLIILVASFNIIATLQVMVFNKTKDIGILRALGLSRRGITLTFIFKGLIIGSFGIVSGCALGIVLCQLLKNYQFIKLPKDIYYLDRIPVVTKLWPDLVLIVVATFLIILISTIYPAKRAANINVAEALRYE
jgi:lipoprotein-releasing system permease protein